MLLRHPLRSVLRPPLSVALGILLGVGFAPAQLFANNEPGAHFEAYDPNTLLHRRNRLTWSEDFTNPAWARTNLLSVTSKPDGVGDLIVPNTTNASHFLSSTAMANYGSPAAGFVRAKAGGYSWIAVQVGALVTYFNVAAGIVGTNQIGGTIQAAEDAPGYYDCFFSTVPGNVNYIVYVASANDTASFAGDAVSGVYIARAQHELNATTPSAYQKVTDWYTEYMAAALDRIGMWQDQAGTTPVTAVEQPVGMWRDTKAGYTAGPELVTNGDFSDGTTGWVPSNATQSVTDGELELVATTPTGQSSFYDINTFVVGKTYEVSATFRAAAGNATPKSARLSVIHYGVNFPAQYEVSANGVSRTVHFVFTATNTTLGVGIEVANLGSYGAIGDKAYLSNVSVRFLDGNHATQAGSSSRPILSARVNLMTSSDVLHSWDKTSSGTGIAPIAELTGNTSPEGGALARLRLNKGAGETSGDFSVVYREVSGTLRSGVSYRSRIWLQSNTAATYSVNVRCTWGASPDNVVEVTPVGNWYEFYTAAYTDLTGPQFQVTLLGGSGSSSAADILAGAVDIRSSQDAALNQPAYQRVNTATDYDTEGFIHYLKFDGTDDGLQTPAINFSGASKVTVWAGVTKLSDSVAGIVAELTASASANDGGFFLAAPAAAAANVGLATRGTTAGSSATFPATAPVSGVVTGMLDNAAAAASQVQARFNGAVQAMTVSTGPTSAGNYANAVLNIGRRNNASVPFNGRLTSLTLRGSTTPASEVFIRKMEQYAARRAGKTFTSA